MKMNKLTPEQERALDICVNNLSNFTRSEITPVAQLKIEQVSIANSQLFVDGKVNRKTLPHEAGWLWNQTKSKVEITINDHEKVIMAKFNPRKHPKAGIYSQPSYKLWVCQIISKTKSFDNSQLNFLWVEKGKKDKFAPPPLVKKGTSPQPPVQELKLSDLSFLGEFVTPEVACQLGWEQNPQNFQLLAQPLDLEPFIFDFDCLIDYQNMIPY